MDHKYDYINIFPLYASSQNYSNMQQEVLFKRTLQEPQYLQINNFHAMMQPTRGWMLNEYA